MTSTSPLIPRVGNEEAVAECWERFLQNTPLPRAAVRDVVLESWQRCRAEAVDPKLERAPGADESALRRLREEHRALYRAARPVLENLREILTESGTLILLTDARGTIIDLLGNARARHAGEAVNLAPGGRWQEEISGTNAIGTAIAAHAPVQIYASEHYCLDVKHWTCAAAPIFDASRRQVLGVIDISGGMETFHAHSLGLVMSAAREIEAVLARQELEQRQQLIARAEESFSRYSGDFLVLFDHRGRVLKSNGHLQAARERHGVDLSLATGANFAPLDTELPGDHRQQHTPGWLNKDWLQTIRPADGEPGQLLVVPLGLATSPRVPARPVVVAAAEPFADVIGHSAVIEAAVNRARRLARLDLPVMLLGETGVGKEVFARAIHKSGALAEAPFVAVNCGALTRELLASELFGHVEGAFTGARKSGQAGKFEQADGGTLFLDEIGEMPPDMQPHLLRVLQDGVVVRLGDTRERRVAVRIIAATNRDLRGEVAAGRFREDLFHRLCATSLRLPALRERAADIAAIVAALNQRLAQKYGVAPKHIGPEVQQALARYRWPGNVRELQNVFEAVFALCDGDRIELADLPDEILNAGAPMAAEPVPGRSPDLSPSASPVAGAATTRLDALESQAILAAIASVDGNVTRAARALGISRSTLYLKLAALRHQAPPRPQ